MAPPAGPVCLCFCRSSYVSGGVAQNSLKELHLCQILGRPLLQVCWECKCSHLSVRAGFTVSDVFPSWGSVLAGSSGRGNPWQEKKPTTKGTVGLSSQFNMEEESWRLGWKDKNLISRGRKCRKTNKNDGWGKMDSWKEDLTWCSSGSD